MCIFVATIASKLQETIARWKNEGIGFSISGTFLGIFNYADDFVFVAAKWTHIQVMLNETATCLKQAGLEFSFKPRKTAIMSVLDNTPVSVSVAGHEVSWAEGGTFGILNN
eukprot:4907152-Karenia_brevis.AAC.1